MIVHASRRPAATAPLFALGLLVLLGAAGCKKLEPNPVGDSTANARLAAERARIGRACASEITYQRLKELAFDEARRVRNAESPNLERLAAATVIRMESPVVKSRDEKLNVTVCQGRLIFELPPGSERGFGGERRLTAEIEYAAQAAADGSGLVYQMDGAEPIVYRLAAFDLPGRTIAPPVEVAALNEPEPAPRTELARAEPPARAEPVARPVLQPPPVPIPTIARPTERPRPAEPPAIREMPAEQAEPRPVRASAARPSFNCRYARSRVEQMICSSDRLAAQDRRMASLFYAALAAADGEGKRDLQRSRGVFVSARDRCRSEDCVARSYEERIAELADYDRGGR